LPFPAQQVSQIRETQFRLAKAFFFVGNHVGWCPVVVSYAFSKKLENFQAAVALNFVYYNFCKRHITVRMTPAQAAGVESSQWEVSDLVERCGE
jgi:hypothetical protein